MSMTPNRTFLFVPGNHPRKLEKVFDSGADAVIIDLEDAVAIAEKPQTRAVAVDALKQKRQPRGYIRVNAVDTEFCFQDLQNIVGPWLDGIVLPKVESASDYRMVDWVLGNLERDAGLDVGNIDLMPIIETAKGLAAAREIAACGGRIKRLSFGAGDYTRDLNLQWTFGEAEIAAARSELVLASRLANIEPPIDTVFIHIKEHDHFAASARKGREFGFQGKLCIHPNQIEATHAAYTPTEEEARWAKKIIASFEEAEKQGSASIQVDGYFVDYPIVEKAQAIVELYQAVYGE
ncbi:MAG: HpcH/HpaI aldolase/citrate lyase family protein [Gammaproteobacteria bacterium]